MMGHPWPDPFGPRRFPFPIPPPPDFRPDIYAGPDELMEAGARGFLITTSLGREEFALDSGIELLRQASIKLYGGTRLPENKRTKERRLGYDLGSVRMDFMDPSELNILAPPEDEDEGDEEVGEEGNKEDNSKEGEATKEDGDESASKEKETEEDSAMEETKDKEEEENVEQKKEDVEKEEGDEENKEVEKTEKEEGEEEQKSDTDKEKQTEEKKDVKKETTPKKDPVLRMHSLYKFKAFRTEIRNIMFIKSNVPDPMKVADAAMEIILQRKTLPCDAVSQLFPVLGVCKFDHSQLEVVTRRVLTPVFDEAEEPKSFSVILVDKLSEPGSELLYEIVRNAVWCINPTAWLSSPITEPDAVIRVELVGSKLVLCCLSKFMRYRHYCPNLLIELGAGEAEEDDGTWTSAELRKQQELWRLEREKMRELARQREEERRKEREKRRAEAEARRKEAEKQREKERAEKKRSREESKKSDSKDDENEKEDGGSQKEDEKGGQARSAEENEREEKDENAKENEKEEKLSTMEDAEKEEDADKKIAVEKTDEEDKERKNSESEESPPKKKQRLESSEVEEDMEKEDTVEESEDLEEEETTGKKTTPKKKSRAKRGGRRRSSK